MPWLLTTIICIEILAWGEIDILVPSFPNIQDEFQISTFKTELLLSMNLVAQCLASLFVGKIADIYDKRNVIIFSFFIFLIGSILGYFSAVYELLLFGRILQGVGIAGPMLLGNVLISNYYSLNLQQQLIGVVNGLSTVVLIFAPLIGSSINILFGWRSNFIALTIMVIANIILSYLYIPTSKTTEPIIEQDSGYREIIMSKKIMAYSFIINLSILPYWTFIGLAPILFVKGLGVSLKTYSIYQTSLAISFAFMSFVSIFFIKKIGVQKSFYFGILTLFAFVIFVIYIIFFRLYDPLMIVLSIHLFTIGTVFVYNILTPLSLQVLPHAKSRTAAFSTFLKLILVAISVQIASHFYQDNFISLAIVMIIQIVLSGIIYYCFTKKEVLVT